jgi:hypothetical protein
VRSLRAVRDGSSSRCSPRLAPARRFDGYESFQKEGLILFQRYGRVVHGLSWESFHRNQPGRVFALWHHHKDTIGLRLRPAKDHPLLVDDPERQRFLADHPDIEEVD